MATASRLTLLEQLHSTSSQLQALLASRAVARPKMSLFDELAGSTGFQRYLAERGGRLTASQRWARGGDDCVDDAGPHDHALDGELAAKEAKRLG